MTQLPACTRDPERWTTLTPDAVAVAACRVCPIRRSCARAAWHTPGAAGLWAGIAIPPMTDDDDQPDARTARQLEYRRKLAFGKLRSIAEQPGPLPGELPPRRPSVLNTSRHLVSLTSDH